MKLHTKHTLIVSLLIAALLGMQTLQASPVHDHADDVVNCTLCHFDTTEYALPEADCKGFIRADISAPQLEAELLTSKTTHSPYLSRAPPVNTPN